MSPSATARRRSNEEQGSLNWISGRSAGALFGRALLNGLDFWSMGGEGVCLN
jgi:hypothetical protein